MKITLKCAICGATEIFEGEEDVDCYWAANEAGWYDPVDTQDWFCPDCSGKGDPEEREQMEDE